MSWRLPTLRIACGALLALLVSPGATFAQIVASTSTYSVIERIDPKAKPRPATSSLALPNPTTTLSGEALVGQVLKRKLPPEQYEAVMAGVAAKTDKGSQSGNIPSASVPAGKTHLPIARSQPKVSATYALGTSKEAKEATDSFGGIPGGIVLEGSASFSAVAGVGYDSNFNALVLNDAAVYFVPIPPRELAVLSRALARNDLIGVSVGERHQVFGRVPKDAPLTLDLMIADLFLGDIVFAGNNWTSGYRFKDGYRPQTHTGVVPNTAVFFRFSDFQFEMASGELSGSRAALNVRLFPLADQTAPDGSLKADFEAIDQGERISAQYAANAKHIADNVDYFRRERIIERMFAYGEVAAFLRGIKDQGFDLEKLARSVETLQ